MIIKMKKKCKYIVSIILILITLILFNMYSVKAQSNYDYGIQIIELKENNELKLEIKFKEIPEKILGVQGEIEYNNNILELEKINTDNDSWNITAFNRENGRFMIEINDEEFDNESKYIGSGDKIIDAIFKIKKNENTEIKISKMKLVNSKLETIEIEDNKAIVNLNNNIIYFAIIIGALVAIVFTTVILKRKK